MQKIPPCSKNKKCGAVGHNRMGRWVLHVLFYVSVCFFFLKRGLLIILSIILGCFFPSSKQLTRRAAPPPWAFFRSAPQGCTEPGCARSFGGWGFRFLWFRRGVVVMVIVWGLLPRIVGRSFWNFFYKMVWYLWNCLVGKISSVWNLRVRIFQTHSGYGKSINFLWRSKR